MDHQVEATTVVEESEQSDTVVLLFLLVSQCLTCPFPPTERIRWAEYVQQSRLWHEQYQWWVRSNRHETQTFACERQNHSVFNKIRLIDAKQNHHFANWLCFHSPSLFSHLVFYSCKRLRRYSLLSLESTQQNDGGMFERIAVKTETLHQCSDSGNSQFLLIFSDVSAASLETINDSFYWLDLTERS